MNLKNEIVNFITNKELNGALLISGKWGSGKTHLIKEISREFNNNKVYAVAVISLFGIDSVTALAKRVKAEYLEISSSLLGKAARKVGKTITKAATTGMKIATAAVPESAPLAAICEGMSNVGAINIFDSFKVKNEVGIKNKRDFVLVFDDLERSKIETTDLLGAINEFCENRKIKTIIIANEEEIESIAKDEETSSQQKNIDTNIKHAHNYPELKEKVISRTLKLNIDHNEIVNSIIESYKETETGYKALLKGNFESIVCIFRNSEYDNIRSLKCAIANFERVYKVWCDKNFKTDFINRLLCSFLILTMEYKANNFQRDIDNDLNFLEKNTWSKYSMGNFRLIRLDSIDQWIVYGEWDGEKIYQDILSHTSPTTVSAKQKFLHCLIFDLDFETAKAGLLDALNDAYNGNLPYDEMIYLLKQVQLCEELQIKFDFKIEYDKIAEGLNKQIQIIKDGKFNYHVVYPHVASADIKNANANTRNLLEKIRYLIESENAWDMRRKLLDYLSQPNELLYNLGVYCLEEFDDQLFDAFSKAYEDADNRRKCDYMDFFLKINYQFPYQSSLSNEEKQAILSRTINNFTKLKEKISSFADKEHDQITQIIERNHVNNLNVFIERLQNWNRR